MTGPEPYQRILDESLRAEFRISNSHLPGKQKSLSALLLEEYPSLDCNDGSTHLFKRRELEYISGLLEPEERDTLMLPVIIEVSPGREEISIICRSRAEEKLASAVLKMPLEAEGGRIKIYGPQLSELRRHLKTATQYLFSPKITS